ncbi:tRNA lysidine(34) synthetase TilS [Roseobacter sp. MH60115]|uniref:tRNA lysidine(34) synthetase TilS n=1 Tax=Roseobacter sp. MH60115 TaxID=2785324 RepID=UPI0018A2FB6D|nr:tRNA lysidine(34) synthetase TilS [Roseobacter sp. MH60115]
MPQDLGSEVAKHLLPNPPPALGIAVSGGGDSVALVHLLHAFAESHPLQLYAVTVDHGLRAEAAEEAKSVGQLCQSLDIPHTVLPWTGWDGQGNLQKEARDARYKLIAEWARENRLQTIALGHTLDDQAETVLMRLARGAGVDGLSAMTPRRLSRGITWIRPLLGITRADLRHDLQSRGATWLEDPSNDDRRFSRVRMREALKVLTPLGIDAQALGQVAFNMARARDALGWQAFLEARRIARIEAGAVRIDWRAYRTLPDEIARRILLSALRWISGSDYAPRRRPVLALIEALKQGTGGTVDGCQAWRDRDALWIFREYQPVRDVTCPLDAIWDGRWHVQGGLADERLHIAALGADGLDQLPDWRGTGRPREVLRVTPAVWRGTDLVAAPMAGFRNGWYARIEGGEEAFFAALLSH